MPAPKSNLVKRIVRLRKEREIAQQKADKLKAQMDELEPKVLDWLSEIGSDQMRIDGVTVHIRRELWASVGDNGVDFLKDALDAAGIDASTIVAERANTQTLSALIREFDRDGRPLPNSLSAAVKVTEKYRLGFRAS